MRYTVINENTKNTELKTNDSMELYDFEMRHNCNNNTVYRVISSEKYYIYSYKSGYTIYVTK